MAESLTVAEALNNVRESYGLPHDLPDSSIRTFPDLFRHAAKNYGDSSAYTCLNHSISFAELDALSDAFAAWLMAQDYLNPGDRVAMHLPNLLQYPVAAMAVLKAGLILVNTNPLYTGTELVDQFRDADVKLVVTLKNIAADLASIVDQTGVQKVVLTEVADLHSQPKRALINGVVKYIRREVPRLNFSSSIDFREVLRLGRAMPKPDYPTPNEEDVAVLQYTGGTTGGSKGCMLTHGSLISSMHQCTWLYQCADWQEGQSTLVVPLPLYHIYAFDVGFCHCLINGHNTLLIPNPRDIRSFVKTLSKTHFEGFTGLNTLFNALLNNDDFVKLDFTGVRLAIAGGMALSSSIAERWEKLTGSQICEGYGLTESSGILSVNVPGDIRIGTVGIGFSGCEFKIVSEDGESLPVEEAGELYFKGAQMMKGYWNNPEESKNILDEDGWMRTGDIAVMGEDGRLRIVDRAKDMIVVSGFKVFPNEVEDVLMGHPDIVECAVVAGKADAGEFVRAFIVSSNSGLTDEDVKDYCRAKLTAYKIPKQVEFRESLPKSNVGKILRKELRDE